MLTTNMDFSKIYEFSNALDEMCATQDSFFSIALLSLIERYFQYSDTSITAYTNDYKFCGGVAINGAKPLQEYYIRNDLYNWDTYSKYITQQCLNTNGLLPIIVNSSDSHKGGDYFDSDYYNFLNKFGYSWSASMVFGNFRLNFHKRECEGVFDQEEMSFFNTLYHLLASRLLLYTRTRHHTCWLDCLDNIIQDHSIGYMILDSEWKLLQRNDSALKYVSTISPNSNFRYALKSLLELLKEENALLSIEKSGRHSLICKGIFVVEMSKMIQKQEFDFTREFFIITIKRIQDCSTDQVVVRKLFSQKYNISNKELDVIRCMAEGLTYAQIAQRLYISINTVRSHIKSIYMKTNVNNQSSLLALYNKASSF